MPGLSHCSERSLSNSGKCTAPGSSGLAQTLGSMAMLFRMQRAICRELSLFTAVRLEFGKRRLVRIICSWERPLNNLASVYREEGRFAEAEPLYRRSLGIWEKALGPDHPLVAASLINVGELYQAQGRYTEAEPLLSTAKNRESR